MDELLTAHSEHISAGFSWINFRENGRSG